MKAKCGHKVNLPGFNPRNFVCKKCFGFEYNRNTYAGLDDKRRRAGFGEALSAGEKRTA